MKAISIPLRAPFTGRTFDYTEQARQLADLAARATIVVLFSLMAVRFGADFLATGRVTGLFLLLSETLVVVLTVMRRSAATVDRSVRARVLTAVSTLGPPLLAPAALAMVPESVTIALSCAGLSVVIAGKITLGRSFALLPANRGVVSSGVYGIVRHPIYLGYLITHLGVPDGQPDAVELRGAPRRRYRTARPRRLRGADARPRSQVPRLPDPSPLARRAGLVLTLRQCSNFKLLNAELKRQC